MELFAGLDISLTATGLVVVDTNRTIVHSTVLKAPDGIVGIERLLFIRSILTKEIDAIVKNGNVKNVFLESPAYQGTGRLFELGEMTGIQKLLLFEKGIRFFQVAPVQLKKYAMGSGKGKKQLILLDVFKNFGEEFRDDNIADAYVLARMLRDYYHVFILKKEMPIKKYQLEVLHKLHKSFTPLKQKILL